MSQSINRITPYPKVERIDHIDVPQVAPTGLSNEQKLAMDIKFNALKKHRVSLLRYIHSKHNSG